LHFKCVSKPLLRGGVAATLTGGLDSRLLVGISRKKKLDMPFMSTDTCALINDLDVMKPLLDYWQVDCTCYPHQEGYYEKFAEYYLGKAGFLTDMHVWFAPAMQDNVHKNRFYMTGLLGGDFLRTGVFLNSLADKLPSMTNIFVPDLVKVLSNNAGRKFSSFLTDDFTEYLLQEYQKSLHFSIIPFLDSARGVKDWILQTYCVKSVLLITTMYKDLFSSFSPFLHSKVLDIFFTLNIHDLGDDLFHELYECVDSKLLKILSTHSKEIPYPPRQINHEPFLNWAYSRLMTGAMAKEGYIDKLKLEPYFKWLHKTPYPLSSLGPILQLDFWMSAKAQF